MGGAKDVPRLLRLRARAFGALVADEANEDDAVDCGGHADPAVAGLPSQKATVERTEAGAEGGGVSGAAGKPGARLVYEHDTLNSRAILCALTVQACRSASHGRRLPTA